MASKTGSADFGGLKIDPPNRQVFNFCTKRCAVYFWAGIEKITAIERILRKIFTKNMRGGQNLPPPFPLRVLSIQNRLKTNMHALKGTFLSDVNKYKLCHIFDDMGNPSGRWQVGHFFNSEVNLGRGAGTTLKFGGGETSPGVQGNPYPKLKTPWISPTIFGDRSKFT